MKKHTLSALAAAALVGAFALPAFAQNLAIVNGKAVPKARADALAQQIAKSGRAGDARNPGPAQGRSHRPRNLHAGSAKARPGRHRRLQGPAGPGAPDHPDPRTVCRLPEEEPGDRRRHQGRVRQVRGGQRRQGIPRPPHPGGKGRRGQGPGLQASSAAASSTTSPRSSPRTRAPAPTAATWTGPTPPAMCPSSRPPWSSSTRAR
jgi:hypothetical protein